MDGSLPETTISSLTPLMSSMRASSSAPSTFTPEQSIASTSQNIPSMASNTSTPTGTAQVVYGHDQQSAGPSSVQPPEEISNYISSTEDLDLDIQIITEEEFKKSTNRISNQPNGILVADTKIDAPLGTSGKRMSLQKIVKNGFASMKFELYDQNDIFRINRVVLNHHEFILLYRNMHGFKVCLDRVMKYKVKKSLKLRENFSVTVTYPWRCVNFRHFSTNSSAPLHGISLKAGEFTQLVMLFQGCVLQTFPELLQTVSCEMVHGKGYDVYCPNCNGNLQSCE